MFFCLLAVCSMLVTIMEGSNTTLEATGSTNDWLSRVREKIVPILIRMNETVEQAYNEIAEVLKLEFATLQQLETHSKELQFLIAANILKESELDVYQKSKNDVEHHEAHEHERLRRKVYKVWRKLLGKIFKVVRIIHYSILTFSYC